MPLAAGRSRGRGRDTRGAAGAGPCRAWGGGGGSCAAGAAAGSVRVRSRIEVKCFRSAVETAPSASAVCEGSAGSPSCPLPGRGAGMPPNLLFSLREAAFDRVGRNLFGSVLGSLCLKNESRSPCPCLRVLRRIPGNEAKAGAAGARRDPGSPAAGARAVRGVPGRRLCPLPLPLPLASPLLEARTYSCRKEVRVPGRVP